MARLDGPADLDLFEVRFVNRGSLDTRNVWARNWRQARQLILDRASCFGLSERVIVLGVCQIAVVEPGLRDERSAA